MDTGIPATPFGGSDAKGAPRASVSAGGIRAWRWSIILPVSVLLASIALQATHLFRESPAPRPPHLARAVPAELDGWTGRDVPLGPNEFVASAAEKILNYDEVVNREFSRPGQSFGVYVAYWGAGKMPTRLVASHTPDRCWTENGWRCLEMKFKQRRLVDGVELQPAEWRVFEPPRGGSPTYVMYWHLVDGKVYDYGERFNAIPDPYLWWKDAVQQVVLGSREQHFVRISSNEPLENLWSDPGFVQLLRNLASIGLAVPPVPAATEGHS